LFGLVTLGALFFTHNPSSSLIDSAGFALLPPDYEAGWAHGFADIGSLPVLLTGVVVLFVAAGRARDWPRAIACASAPLLAVVLVDEIAKPLVNRHVSIYGGVSYPSGTLTVVSALVTGAVLIVPRRMKTPIALLGTAILIGTSAAVVVLRWHFPTDALGGICTGVGAVFLLDGLLHRSCVRSLARRVARHPPA
jgi:membrane-associated phospholipid phosphatase